MNDVAFAVGTGRCGTKFLAEAFARDPEIASHHERQPFSDTFYRYCKWYGLDVDKAGFLAVKRRDIEADLRSASFSFEASAFLSLALDELHNDLGARIAMMVRRPDRVVASYLQKGWYDTAPDVGDAHRPPTMQNVVMPHHFLGRTMPRGAEFERWRTLTRVGKIAWYWGRLNLLLAEQASRLPSGVAQFHKLESLDFAAFDALRARLQTPANVTELDFARVRRRRPNASRAMRRVSDWTRQERLEFEAGVQEMAEYFGYAWSTEDLAAETSTPAAPSPGALERILESVWRTRPSGNWM